MILVTCTTARTTKEGSRPMSDCPLCHSPEVTPFAEVKGRRYFECATCLLVFMDPEQRLDAASERERYTTHENDPQDIRYRAFLDQVVQPLRQYLAPGAEGLDYGSGPGPTLAFMLAELGFPTVIYDPFFAPGRGVLAARYDFITSTEVAEHFYAPADEFERFDQMLRPGGWLGILTTTRDPERAFATWNYVRDITHVCFYHARTMEWIAERFGWTLVVPSKNVALFQKRANPAVVSV